jgi:Cellulose-binding protein Sde0182, C-terminal domain
MGIVAVVVVPVDQRARTSGRELQGIHRDGSGHVDFAISGPLTASGRAGHTIRLRGTVSDPDHDKVTVRWWHYQDAGTYPGEIAIPNATSLDTTLQIPNNAQPGHTIHVILEATDSGTPSLTRYQRVIVTVPVATQGG